MQFDAHYPGVEVLEIEVDLEDVLIATGLNLDFAEV
jgi:hypothetical protein